MIVRPFSPTDATSLADLFHASVHQVGIRDYSPEQVLTWSPSAPDPGRYIRQAGERTILVAVDADDVPIGYGDLEADGHIDHLYCRPDKVSTGVGTAILAELQACAIRAGIGELFVEASEGARRLFEQHGFSSDGRNDFLLNGVALHNYRMSKRLAG